jgi:RNA polymerase sigma-70 factor (ECF subfamily)
VAADSNVFPGRDGLGQGLPGGAAYASLSDEELMALLSRQEQQAFAALFERYCNLVFSVSMHIVRDSALAEDLVQEVFLRLWRRPDRYQAERGRFLPWLLSVVRHRAIDEQRSRGRRQSHEDLASDPAATLPARSSGDPMLAALVSESQATVREALRALPDEQRRTIELAYFGGLTQREIAEKLDQPLGTVKTRIRLGMLKLRAALVDGSVEGRDIELP